MTLPCLTGRAPQAPPHRRSRGSPRLRGRLGGDRLTAPLEPGDGLDVHPHAGRDVHPGGGLHVARPHRPRRRDRTQARRHCVLARAGTLERLPAGDGKAHAARDPGLRRSDDRCDRRRLLRPPHRRPERHPLAERRARKRTGGRTFEPRHCRERSADDRARGACRHLAGERPAQAARPEHAGAEGKVHALHAGVRHGDAERDGSRRSGDRLVSARAAGRDAQWDRDAGRERWPDPDSARRRRPCRPRLGVDRSAHGRGAARTAGRGTAVALARLERPRERGRRP